MAHRGDAGDGGKEGEVDCELLGELDLWTLGLDVRRLSRKV